MAPFSPVKSVPPVVVGRPCLFRASTYDARRMVCAAHFKHPCPLLVGASMVFLSLVDSRAAAAQPPVSSNNRPIVEALSVQSNACFDATTLAAHVELWLKRSNLDRHIALEVRGDPQGTEGVTIEIRRDGHSVGTRVFPTFTVPCEDIRTAIAMSAALAIDATEHEAQLAEPAAQQPAAVRRLPPPRAARVATSLEGLALVRVLPTWTAGFAPAIAYSVVPAVALRASLLVTSTSSFALSGGYVDMSAIAGRLDACGAVPSGALRLRACAGFIAGRLDTEGSNFVGATSNGTQRRAIVGGLARLDLRIPIAGSVGFLAAADAFVRFTHSDIRVGGGASRPLATIGAMFGGGPEVRFW